MTFDLNGWARITSSGNENCFINYGYKNSSDTLATIKTSAYFNDLMEELVNGYGKVKVGDVVELEGSDGKDKVYFDAVTTAVTVAEFPNSDVADGSISTAKLADGAVTLVKLAEIARPAYVVKHSGMHTTLGGAAAETISVTGVTATDRVFVQMHQQGSSPQTVLIAASGTDEIVVTFSADPSTDHKIYFQVLTPTV
ncbi:MAG: hypothetical protein ACTSP4_00530 [Candidatus Hodarchaeales archaeon]